MRHSLGLDPWKFMATGQRDEPCASRVRQPARAAERVERGDTVILRPEDQQRRRALLRQGKTVEREPGSDAPGNDLRREILAGRRDARQLAEGPEQVPAAFDEVDERGEG